MDIKLNDLVCIVGGNFLMLALFLLFLTGYDTVGIFLCMSAWALSYAAHFTYELWPVSRVAWYAGMGMQWTCLFMGSLAFLHGMVSLAG